MSAPVWGATDILVGHVVDNYGVMHRTWSGDLGGFMGQCSVQMGMHYLTNYEDPLFCEKDDE